MLLHPREGGTVACRLHLLGGKREAEVGGDLRKLARQVLLEAKSKGAPGECASACRLPHPYGAESSGLAEG